MSVKVQKEGNVVIFGEKKKRYNFIIIKAICFNFHRFVNFVIYNPLSSFFTVV